MIRVTAGARGRPVSAPRRGELAKTNEDAWRWLVRTFFSSNKSYQGAAPGDSTMMPLCICVRVLLTFLRAPLKNKNEVMVISHALAQLHAVDDNLKGTLQDHQDERLGVPTRLVESLHIEITSTESR